MFNPKVCNMKKIAAIFIFLSFTCFTLLKAQTKEVVQLTLNYQKLQQLESILENMYKGYEILTKGYNTIKDISEGNFNLHQVFLEGLLAVNPKIKDYYRIPQVIKYQKMLVKEYKASWNYLKNEDQLTADELRYIEKVYTNLFNQSLKDLDELIMATTASKLRMSDDERLQVIDRVFLNMEDKLSFLRYFNSGAQLLCLQRSKAYNELKSIQKLHDVE